MLKRTPELPQASHFPESATSYPALYLNSAWRVILCRDGIQWILQRRNVPAGTGDNRPERHSTDDWRGRSYCRTRSALIRCCDRFCGEIDPAAAAELRTLPDLAEPPSATSPEAKSPDLPPPEPTEAETAERAGSHITFPDRQWHPIGTVNIKEFDDIAGPIPDFLRRGEVRA